MKPQDLVFIVILGVLVAFRKPTFLVFAGLLCIILAIPLFHFWVFFTAQRLIMYAAGFFFVSAVMLGFRNRK